jgi:hypothetical protein
LNTSVFVGYLFLPQSISINIYRIILMHETYDSHKNSLRIYNYQCLTWRCIDSGVSE